MALVLSPTRIPSPRHSGLIGQLNRDWARLRLQPTSNAGVTSWARLHPAALGGLTSLPELEARAAARRGTGDDALMLALLQIAAGEGAGHGLAGRTVLQLMLPKTVMIAARQKVIADRDEAEAAAVAAMWEATTSYPLARRPRSVAANLALDVLNALTGRAVLRRRIPEELTDPHSDNRLRQMADPTQDTAVDLEVAQTLAAAHEAGVITLQEARMLALVYTLGPNDAVRSPASTAADLGVSVEALRQRCSRAVRRIAVSVAAGSARPLGVVSSSPLVREPGRRPACVAALTPGS